MATQIITWFNSHKPFDLADFRLENLSTGLFASYDINCNNAEPVDEVIQNALDNIYAEDVIPRKAQVHTLQLLKPGVKTDSKTVHIDPLIFDPKI